MSPTVSEDKNTDVILETAESALLVIDLQVGVTAMSDLAPHSADQVVSNAARLVEKFHEIGRPVVFVRVNYGVDNVLQVKVPHDWNVAFTPPSGWDELEPRLGARDDDVVIVKHGYCSFYGTALDLQLRRRGITNLVVCGIATHLGVEAAVRGAHDRGYTQILVEDAMSSTDPEQHEYPVRKIFPYMGLVRTTDSVLERLSEDRS